MWYFSWKFPFFSFKELPRVPALPSQEQITGSKQPFNARRVKGIRQWLHRRVGSELDATLTEIERAIISRAPEEYLVEYTRYLEVLKMHEQAIREKA